MEQTNDLSTEEVCLGVDHPPRRSPCIASCTLTPSDLTFSDRPLSGMYARHTLKLCINMFYTILLVLVYVCTKYAYFDKYSTFFFRFIFLLCGVACVHELM